MIQTLAPASSPAFTSAAAEALSRQRGEPAWLLALRQGALRAFEQLPLEERPTGNWRRTSFKGLNLAAQQTPADGPRLVLEPPVAGARVLDLRDALADPALGERVREHLAQVVVPDEDTFTALHYAFLNAGAVVHVPRGVAVEGPVRLRFAFEQPGQAAFVHVLVLADEQAEVSVVEEQRSVPSTDVAPVSAGVVEIVAGPGAHVRYLQVQEWAPDAWAFSHQRAVLRQDASVRLLDVALGARQVRNTVQMVLQGARSQADLLGVVAGTGRQHVDFQTLQDHHGNDTRSDLVIHNALRDRASSNFTGLIRINKTARGTESSQEQKNVLLSDFAKADSDPKLEILNNDVVRCTHGASVGPVDAEQIFYLQTRGLSFEEAQSLVLEGFFQAVIARVGPAGLQEIAWQAIWRTVGGGD